jgi:hydroxymethylbilane synthase
MKRKLRIGTRESQLALWQANEVKRLLENEGYDAELVPIKSEGDIDLKTPLYQLGVQGIFTKALDIALLNDRIDIAVHSMKDVPVQLAEGIAQAAVLPRASHKDVFVPKGTFALIDAPHTIATVATSSIRRKAQWLYRFPIHKVEPIRGNINSRLKKVHQEDWQGAIFAAAGLDRIGLRPDNAIELDWMLPAPAQGAIMVVCREDDAVSKEATKELNDPNTALCTKVERNFLSTLMGGCSTPISGLAVIDKNAVVFKGNVLTPDGTEKAEVTKQVPIEEANSLGVMAAEEILSNGGQQIVGQFRNGQV